MEKYKFLRFFILCNCIILSVQTFGMDRGGDTYTMNSKGGISIMGKNVTVDGMPPGNSGNAKIVETKSTSEDLPGWQYNGLTSGDEIVHRYKIPGRFTELCVKGVKRNLIFNIENLLNDEKVARLKVVGELALVSAFLDIKNDNGKCTIATPSQHSITFGDFNKACAALNIPNKLFVTLLLPNVWENLNINGNNVEIKGSIYNKNPTFKLENCSAVLKGQSNDGAIFSLKKSKFDGSGYRVRQGIVFVVLKDGSDMTCNGSFNRKKPVTFTGTKERSSKLVLHGNVIDDVRDVE